MRKLTTDKLINYLNKDRNFLVVDRAKEAIGNTINSIAKNTIIIKDKLGKFIKKKQIKVKMAQYITAKKDAHPWLKSLSIKRWWIWFLSAENGDFPENSLKVNTLRVSIAGYANIHSIKTGFFTPAGSIDISQALIAQHAIIKPITKLPLSPIKILAGGLLYSQKAKREAIPAHAKTQSKYLPFE